MTPSRTDLVHAIDQMYPGRWALLLVAVCSRDGHHQHNGKPCHHAGKVVIERDWNALAVKRWTEGIGRAERLALVADNLARGGNVGLAIPPGIVALDADTPEATAYLDRALQDAPAQRTARGLHVLARVPIDLSLDATVRLPVAPGVEIDVRSARRSQIVVAPSTHATGSTYSWLRSLPDDECEIPDCPPVVLEKLKERERTSSIGTKGGRIHEGRRNDYLYRIACGMRRRGLSEGEILYELHRENERQCDPPLDRAEVEQIVASAMRHPAGQAQGVGRGRAAAPLRAPWPSALDEAAFHGAAGDFVKAIEEQTEADPAALLVHFLVMFGNMIGRARYCVVEETQHFANLNAVFVGRSAKGRKGTAKSRTLPRFEAIDLDWARTRVLSGLSSGEGLIWQVRDPIVRREPIREKKAIVDYQDVETDPGVADKRLLVYEPEFANVLRVIKRDGNTLSAVLRDAWDRGDLRSMVKNSAAVATGAHVSLIGHVTADELRAELTRTDAASGFGNRFLYVCTKRARLLPEGGNLSAIDFGPLTRALQKAMDFAKLPGRIDRDHEARERWGSAYTELSREVPGLLGAVTSRAEAQVLRLSLVYALLDAAGTIQLPHLEAALAVWRYCVASARHVFGDATGHAVADDVIRALTAAGPAGMTRTEIRDHFGRNRRSDEIGEALGFLTEYGRAACTPELPAGGNARRVERWRLIDV